MLSVTEMLFKPIQCDFGHRISDHNLVSAIEKSYLSHYILAPDEVITATLKVISTITKMILASNKCQPLKSDLGYYKSGLKKPPQPL